MILRIVRGSLPPGTDAAVLVAARARLTATARTVDGLESLLVGAHRDAAIDDDGDATIPIRAALVTVWRDVEAMTRATATAEDSRFIAARLDLPLTVERTDHFELVGRTFAALPPQTTALLRILTVLAGPNDEARLVDTLRDQQPQFVELGIVASHVGRRLAGRGEVEAVHVSVWPDRATIRMATHGRPEAPLFMNQLTPWLDRLHLEMFDGIEIAPRLPTLSGPPLFIIDEHLRIVDITATAAAMLGMPAVDMVGQQVDRLSGSDAHPGEAAWSTLLEEGTLSGETAWAVPDVGAVVLRFVARRDTPVPGRHAVLVRRHHDAPPTMADLDGVIAASFPVTTERPAERPVERRAGRTG